jgi:phospholipid-binding lipoprotein MlaA
VTRRVTVSYFNICILATMKKTLALAALTAALALGACSTPDPQSVAQNDPWEKTNRAVFDFDIQVDHAVARPVAEGYRDVVPQFARDGVHNALTNLNAPVVFVNDVLQGDPKKATDTAGRFLVNSTAGLGGFVDVASPIGIPGHDNDFGITLGKYGVGEGNYLVLPFLGPKPPRDAVGQGVDIAFDPTTWMSWNNITLYQMIRAGVTVLDDRESTLDAVDSIERSSIDFYATTRSLYRQNRNAQIKGDAANDNLPNF